MLVTEVDRYIEKHQLIKPNSKIMIGVSGGPDSMALLHYLLTKRSLFNLDLIAVTVEHGLRGEASLQDVEYVRNYCLQKQIQFVTKQINVKEYQKAHKLGTQEASRILRYHAFNQLMKSYQADYLALAHHADDQVETVFMRLTRGTHLDSLQGIKNKRDFSTGILIRPFLSITKEMIEQYCEQQGIRPRRDQSNEQDTYTRNYFRLHVLPLLKQKNPNLTETILHMTDKIAEDSQYLNIQAKKLSQELLTFSRNPKKVTVRIKDLIKHPRALQRRLFHLILEYLYEELPDRLNYRHENQFFDLINHHQASLSIDLPLQLEMIKSYQLVTFQFKEDTKKNYHIPLIIPGKMALPNHDELITEVVDTIESTEDTRSIFYIPIINDQLPDLFVRSRLPGDRIYLVHLNGRKKVSRIFIDEKIPLAKREQWPILITRENHILWVVGLEKSDRYMQVEATQYLKITHRESIDF